MNKFYTSWTNDIFLYRQTSKAKHRCYFVQLVRIYCWRRRQSQASTSIVRRVPTSTESNRSLKANCTLNAKRLTMCLVATMPGRMEIKRKFSVPTKKSAKITWLSSLKFRLEVPMNQWQHSISALSADTNGVKTEARNNKECFFVLF